MRPFRHVRASTVDEACALLAEHGSAARANAGGTDLLGALKDRIYLDPIELVVDLKAIPGLDGIEVGGVAGGAPTGDPAGATGGGTPSAASGDGALRIGALTRLVDIARSEAVRERWPILAEAAHSVASPQIRNVGTLGGNLCQEVRCWYFRYPAHVGGAIPCLRKKRPKCAAVKGDARYHAIVEGRGCFAVCPSDTATALAALEATVVFAGAGGSRREVPVQDLYEPLELTLERGEIVTEVRVPAPPPGARMVWLKQTVRDPIDFAVVSTAVSLAVEGGVCTGARVVLGAVGPRPFRAIAAEEGLVGGPVDEAAAAEAAAAAVAGAKPLRGNGYKVEIARTLVRRAVVAAGRA